MFAEKKAKGGPTHKDRTRFTRFEKTQTRPNFDPLEIGFLFQIIFRCQIRSTAEIDVG